MPDLKLVIGRAQKAGVKKIINIGSDWSTSREAIKLAGKFSGLFATISLHPIHIEDEEFTLGKFRKLAQNPKVVAIGETGLDYQEIQKSKVKMKNDRLELKNKQRGVFEKLLDIATELKKPVIIHCREAEDEMIEILSNRKQQPYGVWHCFMKDWGLARKILDLGFLISFTGAITYNLSKKTKAAIEKIPLEKIMIETDCPFMTPLAQRKQGIKRCEPAFVVEVAKKIAEIKNLSLAKVAKQTSQNAEKLFQI